MAVPAPIPGKAIISSVGGLAAGGNAGSNPLIQGTADAGTVVLVFDGVRCVGSALVAGNGNWSFQPTLDMKGGTHQITAIATAGDNNYGASSTPFNITVAPVLASAPAIVDVTHEAAPGHVLSPGATSDTHPVVNGTGTAGHTVKLFDGATLIGSALVDASGHWSVHASVALADGERSLTATDTTPGGTTSVASVVFHLTVDTSTPAAPTIGGMTDDHGLPISGGTTGDPHPVINGHGTPGDTITIFDGDTPIGSAVIGADGAWSVAPATDLTPGAHDITIIETNPAGTPSAHSDPFPIVYLPVPAAPLTLGFDDQTGPIKGILANGAFTDASTTLISGTGTAGDLIKMYDGAKVIGSVTVDATGHWAMPPATLADGAHTLYVTATNASGESAHAAQVAITVDTSVPAAPVIVEMTDDVRADMAFVSGDTSESTSPHVTFTSAPGMTVSIYDNGRLLVSGVVDTDSSTWILPPLINGDHTLTIRQTNAAGTQGPVSPGFAFTVNPTPLTPVITEILDSTGSVKGAISSGGFTDEKSPSISGTGTRGEIIKVYDAATLIGSAIVDTTGHWTLTPSSPLSDGAHGLIAFQTNKNGLVSAGGTQFNFTIDTSTPAAPSIALVVDATGAQTGPVANGGTMDDTRPTVSGHAIPGDTVQVYDGATLLGSALVDASGNWSVSVKVALSDGPHTLTAVDLNRVGTPSAASAGYVVHVDTTTPAAPVIKTVIDAVGEETGAIAPGATTDDTEPVLNGTGHAGDLIKIYDGAVLIGSAVVAGDGTGSVHPVVELHNGPHTLVATATNLAGTQGAASDGLTFTVATTAPAAPFIVTVMDATGKVQGPVPDGGTTDETRPAVSGTGTAGDIVKLYDHSTLLGSATVDSFGRWSITVSTALPDGAHSLSATDTNHVGVVSVASAPISFTVQTGASPAPSIDSVLNTTGFTAGAVTSNGTTGGDHPAVSGAGHAGDTIRLLDGNNVVGSTVVKNDGTWSIQTSGLSNGVHDFAALSVTVDGFQSAASPVFHFTVDSTVPPPVSIYAMQDNMRSGSFVANGGTLECVSPYFYGINLVIGNTIRMYDGDTLVGSMVVSVTSGTIKFPALANGLHLLTLTQTNALGVESAPVTYTVTINMVPMTPDTLTLVDSVGPVTGLIASGGITDDSHPTFQGIATRGQQVLIYDGATLVGQVNADTGTGNWSFKPTTSLTDGPHDFYAVSKNSYGMFSPASPHMVFTVDTVTPLPPTIDALQSHTFAEAGSVPAGGTTDDTVPTITGHGVAGHVIKLYDAGSLIGSAVVDATGTWSVVPTKALTAGTHLLSATDTNGAGVLSAASAGFTFTVADPAPVAPLISNVAGTNVTTPVTLLSGGVTNATKPAINGKGVAGHIVTLFDNGAAIGSALVAADGTWSIKPATALAGGIHSLSATDTVLHGKTSATSAAFELNVETTPSPVPVIASVMSHVGTASVPLTDKGTTYDAAPVVSGSAHKGDVVTVYDGALKLGTVIADSNGAWSMKVPASDNAMGAHTISATATNTTGTAGAASAGFTYTLATWSASAPSFNYASDSLNGSFVQDGGTFESAQPKLNFFNCTAGNLAILYVDGIAVATVPLTNPGGNASFTYPTLANGPHVLGIAQASPDGLTIGPIANFNCTINTTPSTPSAVQVNETAAGGSGLIAAGNVSYDGKLVFSGTGTKGHVIVVHDGALVLGSATVGSDGKWSFQPASPLGNGSHDITVTQTNIYGVSSAASPHMAFDVATVPPPPPVIASIADPLADIGTYIPEGGTSNNVKPFISGRGVAGDLITIYDNGTAIASAVVGSSGNWVIGLSVPLAQGEHVLSATQTDTHSLVSAASNAFDITVSSGGVHSVHAVEPVQTDVVDTVDTVTDTNPHTVVHSHEAFVGTAAHETIDLAVDPAAYFRESTAHIEGAKGGIDVLALIGDNQVLDLTSLTGKTASAKISGVEVFDLGGHQNTLKLSLVDVLNLGEQDIFQLDGHQQLMINGKEGDSVDLSNSHVAGLQEGEWQAHGTTQVGGIEYNVYEHAGAHAELLVQQGVQTIVH